jgi:hypothetical protein
MEHPNAVLMYPKSAALGLKFVATPGAEHAGFDEDELKEKLGATRFNGLMSKVTTVFSCGHRLKDGGVEAHAIYAEDLERFLQAEG